MKILILEDNQFDSDLTQRKIKSSSPDAQVDTSTTIRDARQLIKNTYDVALLDLKLPDGFGTNILSDLIKSNKHMVVIMLTGSGDEEIAVAALKSGADDYILKKDGYLSGLPEIIKYHLSEKRKTNLKNNEVIQVLFLEHHKTDIDLTLFHFKRFAPQFKFKIVNIAEEALDLLSNSPMEPQNYQILLMDYQLPGMSAFEMIKIIRQERKLDIPIIIVTGQGNEEVAILALKMGVDEYLVKRENYLYRLPSLLMSSYQKNLLEKQKNELMESESRYRMLANNAGDVIFTLDLDLNYTFISPSVYKLRGYTPEELLKQNIVNSLSTASYENAVKIISNSITEASSIEQKNTESILLELEMVKKDKTTVWTEVKASLLTDDANNPIGILGVTRDISKRKIAEIELKKSREEYKMFFDDDLTGDFIASVNGKLLNCNPAYLQILGFNSKEEALMLDLYKIYKNTNDRNIILDQVRVHGRLINYEYELLRRNGETIFVIANIIGIFNSKNELEAIKGYLIDNTERKHAFDNLRKLSKAVEQSPASIIITDIKGTIEYVNPKFTEISGYTLDEIRGKNTRIFKSGKTSNSIYEKMWTTILSGEDWIGELENKRKDGSVFWENVTITCIKNNEGKITHLLGVKEDITERKKMIDELIQAKEKAEENDNLKTAFLANMSHEIRSPMNAVLGFSQLLTQEDIKDNEKIIYAEYIRNNGESLVKIIDDIIDISIIQSKQVTINKAQFDLNKIFNELKLYYSTFLLKKSKNNLKLNCVLPQILTDAFIIYTDEVRLKQILNNLVSNAIKYTQEGEISMGYILNGDNIEIFVSDTGQGISDENQNKIFDRFVQYSNEYVSRYEGVGLGLPISKELVSMLGGKLKVKSQLGIGSTFYFELPLIKVTSPEIKEKVVFQNQIDYNLNNLNILVVDDEESNYILAQRILKQTKINMYWAQNGKVAVEMALKNPYDLIIMDIKMPVMDGVEATRLIRQKNKSIPIIIQTAFAMPNTKKEAQLAGCNDFITKPIALADFIALVNKYLH